MASHGMTWYGIALHGMTLHGLRKRRELRRGMTLIELLAVIVILAILFSVAIPLVKPAFKDRKLREASRQVNAFVQSTKAAAAESGRPAGVWIEPYGSSGIESKYAFRLYRANVAAPFAGASLNSTVRVAATRQNQQTGNLEGVLQFSDQQDGALLATLLDSTAAREAFKIKLNYREPEFGCVFDKNATEFLIDLRYGLPGWLTNDNGGLPGRFFSFQITRAPVKSAGAPLDLPANTVIDLGVSGIGAEGNEFNSEVVNGQLLSGPVIIMFSPAGHVKSVYAWQVDPSTNQPTYSELPPTGPIHLLIGRNTQVIDPLTANFSAATDPLPNLADPSTRWVSISNKTGSVTANENDNILRGNPPANLAEAIRRGRSIAREGGTMGGR